MDGNRSEKDKALRHVAHSFSAGILSEGSVSHKYNKLGGEYYANTVLPYYEKMIKKHCLTYDFTKYSIGLIKKTCVCLILYIKEQGCEHKNS